MTSTITTAAPVRNQTGATQRTAVVAAALVAALACAGYIAGLFLLSGMSNAEAQRAPITVAECLLAGLAYVAVAVTLPHLADGTRLPWWALSFAAAGCAFLAIQAWSLGTTIADLANKLPADQFDSIGKDETLLFLLMLIPVQVLCLISFVTLAVVAWRRKAMSRGASVLLILAGLAALLGPFPPVGLLAGLAIAWAARSAQPDN
jgi:hypothetical protein